DREPDHGDRVQVHHGTRESPARVAWLGGPFWQVRLEQRLVPAPGDRLVVRQIAPPDTLGGGVVLDAHPKKHGPSRAVLVRLERLVRGEREPDDERARERCPPERSAPAPRPAPVSAELSDSARALEQQLLAAGSEPPPDSELDPDDLAALREAGLAVRVSRKQHFHADVLAELGQRVIDLAAQNGRAVTL